MTEHQEVVPDRVIRGGDSVTELVEELRQLDATDKVLKDTIKEIADKRAKIITELEQVAGVDRDDEPPEDKEVAMVTTPEGKPLFRVSHSPRETCSAKKLRAKYPDIAHNIIEIGHNVRVTLIN